MRAILGCALAVALVANAGFAEDKKEEKIDAKKLIGKWEPKEKKEDGKFTIEFAKDGKVTINTASGGKDTKIEGTYKLDGNKLTLTTKFEDKETKMIRTVSKLTDTELVSSKEDGKEDTLVKIKEK